MLLSQNMNKINCPNLPKLHYKFYIITIQIFNYYKRESNFLVLYKLLDIYNYTLEAYNYIKRNIMYQNILITMIYDNGMF